MRRHLVALGVGALCLTLPGLAFGAQSNTTAAVGTADAANGTSQSASGGSASQSATTVQLLPVSAAPAVAPQVLPVNVHLPVRILSPGDDGQSDQSNAASAESTATNAGSTTQTASGGDSKGDSKGAGSASQSATTAQLAPVAPAVSAAPQLAPVNADVPVRIASPGDDAGTTQTNAASAAAEATNANGTTQVAGGQDKYEGKGGWGSGGSASQSATTGQLLPIGLAPALAPQPVPLNLDVPVRAVDRLPTLPIDPFAALADPVGTVTALLGGLPLPSRAGLPLDPFALLGSGLAGLPVGI